MRYLFLILSAFVLAGCAATFTEKTIDTVNKNAESWDRIHTLATLALPDGVDLDGKSRAAWLVYIVRAETNAIILKHKAAGTKITYAEALAQAEQVVLP